MVYLKDISKHSSEIVFKRAVIFTVFATVEKIICLKCNGFYQKKMSWGKFSPKTINTELTSKLWTWKNSDLPVLPNIRRASRLIQTISQKNKP